MKIKDRQENVYFSFEGWKENIFFMGVGAGVVSIAWLAVNLMDSLRC